MSRGVNVKRVVNERGSDAKPRLGYEERSSEKGIFVSVGSGMMKVPRWAM